MQDDHDTYKIVVIGGSGVGKTNISTRFVRNLFNEVSQSTLGVQFMSKDVDVNGKKIKITLWDTAGQERYKALSKVYYKGASAAIVVYDITDAKSYVEVESWMRLLNQNLNLEDIVIALVGNKSDLQEQREVPSQRPIQEFKQAFDIDCWQVSAKTGKNIEQLFMDLITKVVEKASDIKSTMFRGTVEYAQSERGTYIPVKQSKMANIGNHQPVIIEEEQDEKNYEKSQGKRGPDSVNFMQGRMTLSANERLKHCLANENKKKCCFR